MLTLNCQIAYFSYFKSIVLETTVLTTPSTEQTTVATTSVPPSTVANSELSNCLFFLKIQSVLIQ